MKTKIKKNQFDVFFGNNFKICISLPPEFDNDEIEDKITKKIEKFDFPDYGVHGELSFGFSNAGGTGCIIFIINDYDKFKYDHISKIIEKIHEVINSCL